jgi:hypothetical protein
MALLGVRSPLHFATVIDYGHIPANAVRRCVEGKRFNRHVSGICRSGVQLGVNARLLRVVRSLQRAIVSKKIRHERAAIAVHCFRGDLGVGEWAIARVFASKVA